MISPDGAARGPIGQLNSLIWVVANFMIVTAFIAAPSSIE